MWTERLGQSVPSSHVVHNAADWGDWGYLEVQGYLYNPNVYLYLEPTSKT